MAFSVSPHVETIMRTAEAVESTITAAGAVGRVWDVLIVGAGPAGSLAAHELARRGVRTLLVDRARFPRYKVCGSCLSAAGLRELAATGLGSLPALRDAPRLRSLRVHTRGHAAEIPIPAGAAISRRALDSALVREASR